MVQILIHLELNNLNSKKIMIVLAMAVVFFSSACSQNKGMSEPTWAKSKIYEVKQCGANGSCYFQYPLEAKIVSENGIVKISNPACDVRFSPKDFSSDDSYELQSTTTGGNIYESCLQDNKIICYSAYKDGNPSKFWLYNDGKDISACTNFVDELIKSFSDKPVYFNEKFGYRTVILPQYKLEYLSEGEGITMSRMVDGNELKMQYDKDMKVWPKAGSKDKPVSIPYLVEIGVIAMENTEGYRDLGAYIKSECVDCSTEFLKNGVFLDKDMKNYSERLFLMMSDDKKLLYRAFLRMPRSRFEYFKDEFVNFAKSIELF